MRVDVVSNLYPPAVVGGAERSVHLLVEGLRARGCDVRVITLATPGSSETEPSPEHCPLPNPNPYWAYDSTPHSAPARLRWHVSDLLSRTAVTDVRTALATSPPDIVLTQNLTGLGLPSVRAARAAAPHAVFVHTLRDYSLTCVRATRYRAGSTCTRTCLECVPRLLASRLTNSIWDGVVGVSRAVVDAHLSLGLFRRVPARVIPNSAPPRQRAARPDRRPGSLGYLGRICEEKGIYDLLRALRRLSREGLDVPPLLVAGDAGPADSARFDAESSGLPVRRLGWVEPQVLLSRCDWLVVPSRWQEPFGRVVLDGAAHGTGLVVARAGGLPEAVRAAGRDDAVFFEPGDVPGLAARLSTLPTRTDEPAGARGDERPQPVAAAYLSFSDTLRARSRGRLDEP